MKRIAIFILLTPILVLQSCEKMPEPTNLSEEVDRLVKPYIISGDRPGIAIGIYDNGQVSYYNYGVQHLQNGGAIDEHTLFEIGSLTKPFTASLLAIMAEKGEVAMDDSLQPYLPADISLIQKGNEPIRLSHLVNHTSGWPRIPDNTSEDSPFYPYSINDLKDFINGYKPPRKAGIKYEYSNLGMGLLGYILKEERHSSYFDLVQSELLVPLNMNETFLNAEGYTSSKVAQGYEGNEERDPMLFSEVFEGAGVLNSTSADMVKFIEAQFETTATPLNLGLAKTHEATFTVTDVTDVGMGWLITRLEDDQLVHWHNGGTAAFNSYMAFNKETQKGVVLLMNSRNYYYSGEVDLGMALMKAIHRW